MLTIQTLDAFDQAEALSAALRRIVEEAPGWSYQVLDQEYALLVLTASLACDDKPDAACEEKIAEEIHVDRYIWGTMEKDGSEVVGELHLWTRGQGSKMAKFRYSDNLTTSADETLLEIARQKFAEIGGGPPESKLTIQAGKVSGKVFLDGKEAGELKDGVASLSVTPGPHKIRIEAPGYQTMEGSVEIRPRQEGSLTLTPSFAEAGPDVQKILGGTAIGLAVAAAGVGVFGGVRVLMVNSDLDVYKNNTPGNSKPVFEGDGCERSDNGAYPNMIGGTEEERAYAMSLCDDGALAQTLQFVFWPISAAFGVAGTVLLATADWSDKKSQAASLPFVIIPSVGPSGGGAVVAGRF
ncbi:MAG: PEGA domain-containing protein [Polyangiaceae bacterium]